MIAARRVLSPPAFVLCAFAFSVMATPARADPCEGRLPSQPGQQFSGTVRYVGDGDGLCVGNSNDPNTWIEVRLADFDAPELHAPDGRLIDFSRADAALMASSGIATSMSFFL